MADQRSERQQKIRLELEAEAPQKIGQEFQILTTAIVTKGSFALSGQNVQFFMNGFGVGSPAQTDPNGRVSFLVTGIPLDARNVTIEAQVMGKATRGRRVVGLLSETTKRQPHDIELKGSQSNNGKWLINATIVDSAGIGTPGTIRVLSEGNFTDYPTDPNGVVVVTLEAPRKRQREFKFLAIGTSKDQILRLSGPKKKPRRPEPSSGDISNPFRAFVSGWKARKKADKR